MVELKARVCWSGEDGDLEITTFVDTCMAVRGQASALSEANVLRG